MVAPAIAWNAAVMPCCRKRAARKISQSEDKSPSNDKKERYSTPKKMETPKKEKTP